MGRHLRIILHGRNAENAAVRAWVEKSRKKGHTIDVRVTWEPGDAVWMSREAAEAGVQTVVAGGGDGTINEAVQGLWQSQLPEVSLGILPLGTGNDLASAAGIPTNDPNAALDLVLRGKPTPIDVGQVEDRVFLNMGSLGMGTRITTETSDEFKEILGNFAYFITGLTRFSDIQPIGINVRGKDFEWQGNCYFAAIGNGRRAGGGIELCPGASIDDRLLDLAILQEIPEDELLKALKAFLTEGLAAIEKWVVRARLSRITVSSDDRVYLNLDGEPLSGDQFCFEIAPRRLPLHLPAGSPLLQ